MTGLHPALAAFEGFRRARRQIAAVLNGAFAGFRLMRDHPAAVGAWWTLWLVGFSASAVLLVFSRPFRSGHYIDYSTLAARLGPFAVVIIAAFLLIWALNTVAVFRAALQPDRPGVFYVQLGPDELRLAVMTVVACLLIVVLGGTPAFLLLTVFTPFLQILPDQARAFAFLGATATICVDAWISVRLSLIAVETFAEGRFHLSAYWPLTRGRFWYMFFVYFVCFVMILVLLGVLGLVTAGVSAIVSGIGPPRGADVVRRVAFLGLAGVYTGVVSAFWVVTTTLVCASQAHVFRTITGVHRRRMPIMARAPEDVPGSGAGARALQHALTPRSQIRAFGVERQSDPIGEVDRGDGADIGHGEGLAGDER
jgi:hypothetical protein